MKSPSIIVAQFKRIVKGLRESNHDLRDKLKEALRGAELYRECYIDERRRIDELVKENYYLQGRVRSMEKAQREMEVSFQKRLWQAHNPHVKWED